MAVPAKRKALEFVIQQGLLKHFDVWAHSPNIESGHNLTSWFGYGRSPLTIERSDLGSPNRGFWG